MACIMPIHKRGDKLTICNYWPISVTSSCCKLLEVPGYLASYLVKNNILSAVQHGLRKDVYLAFLLTLILITLILN